MRVHICFVCKGNICRSAIAEAVFTKAIADRQLEPAIRVSSAGIIDSHVGKTADPRALRVLDAAGYPCRHRAKQVGPTHLEADVLVAMDRSHVEALGMVLDDARRVRLFGEFIPGDDGSAGSMDVPDPYYGDDGDFVEVLRLVERAVPQLLALVLGDRPAQ